MADHPLEIPERFRAFALEHDADVHVDHMWGAEIDGVWYPDSWHIVLFRERQIGDIVQVRCITMPDDVEERAALWPVQLDLLDAAWKAQLEDYYGSKVEP